MIIFVGLSQNRDDTIIRVKGYRFALFYILP